MMADKEKAIQLFSQSLELDPSFAPALFYRGMAQFKLGRYEEAIKDFDKLYNLDSSSAIIHAYKGFAYRQLGREEESLQAFNRYVKSRDSLNSLDYKLIGKAQLKTGDIDGAITNFEQALKKTTGESEYFYLFRALYANASYEEALVQINNAIDLNNNFYGYFINRGNTQLMLGKFNDALTDYDYALQLEPGVPDSYFLRARALDTLKRHEEAVLDFSRAIQLNPNDGTYYSKRGNARFAMGERTAACLDWTVANNLGYYEDFKRIKSLCE
jgi:tetratricopeptide (TPR) repeat protein